MRNKLFIVLLLGLLLVGALQAASVAAQQSRVNTGNVRIINAMPGIGAVDVFVDNERVAFLLAPGVSTPYIALAVGRHALAVRPVGAEPLSAPIADLLLDVPANASQTAVIYQRQFSAGAGDIVPISQAAGVFIINDDRSPISLGRTRLQVAHLAVGSSPRISVGYPSGEALLHQVQLATPFGTIDIDAGAYSLAILDESSGRPSVLERLGEQNLYANTLYTVIVVPDVAPAGPEANAVGAISANTRTYILSAPLEVPSNDGLRLRIIHAAVSTAVLDIYIDERLVASRVNFGRSTEYLSLAEYSHTITVRRFGEPLDRPALGRANFTITDQNSAQINWTLLLVNSSPQNTAAIEAATAAAAVNAVNAPTIIATPGGQIMMALLPDNISETQRDFARIRVINAAEGVQSVAAFTPRFPLLEGTQTTTTGEPVEPPEPVPLPGLSLTQLSAFGSEAAEADIPAGLYEEINFVPIGSTRPLTTLRSVQLVEGVVYTFVVVGSPVGDPPVSVLNFADYGVGIPLLRAYIGTVVVPAARVRRQPNTSSTIIATLLENTTMDVLGRNVDATWLRVRFIDPRNNTATEGWVSAVDNLLSITRLGVPVQPASLPEFTLIGS